MPSTVVARKKAAAKKAMAKKPDVDFLVTFEALKKLLLPYERKAEVRENSASGYSLYTKKKIYRGQQVYFAGVKINKNYVSLYLMTVYGSPEQKRSISPQLKKRMQGNACFNFASPEPALLKELDALVKTGAKRFLEVDELDVTGMKCD